ncbi:MAG TPA: phosphotransferase [Thermoanaerobaculaceae bacterium]|nr:phosphotransferase [Thermoanaerobaculaceae bacterium]
MDGLPRTLMTLGFEAVAVEELAGDASHRRFFRVALAGGGTAVAAVYPAEVPGQEEQAARDHAVQAWGWERGLPIPRPLGLAGLVTVSEDLGSDDLDRAAARLGAAVLAPCIEALAAFQRCRYDDLPTPPFDAAFFRRELAVFEEHALTAPVRGDHHVGEFLDGLAARVAAHPYRLVHRDFHFNNLFLCGGAVRAVDFQDMRGGPDTYDLASLLRERGGAAMGAEEAGWVERAAGVLAWPDGWRLRYRECAAQRGLKVVGTFLRLSALGRHGYGAWLPEVRRRAVQALSELEAPAVLRAAVGRPGPEGL